MSLAGEPWLEAQPLKRVFAALSSAGGAQRIAGGAVRNALLGEPIADVDIATTLTPEAVMAAGRAADLGVHPTGLAHGTVMLVADGMPFEVTTLRVDVETDGRRAKVRFTSDWEADARRRDFTINALFCEADGTVVDLVGGATDIAKRRVRFVGRARDRIAEDYLRILRFFRFHARYGRGAPDADGLKACTRMRKGLRGLSAERIRQELLKLLAAPRAAATVAIMAESRVLHEILPKPFNLTVLTRLARIDTANGFTPQPLMRLHALVPHADDLGSRLRLSNDEARRIKRVKVAPAPSPRLRANERRAILYQLKSETWRDAVLLAWARARAPATSMEWGALYRIADDWRIPAFPLDGNDLIAHGMAPGPAVGRALAKLEDHWVAADFAPGRAALLGHLEKHKRFKEED